MSRPLAFYEFFAGGGMARLGLGAGWDCAFANDFDAVKAATYRANFGGDDLKEGDVFALTAADLPGQADLAWASSPCQDFSLAGKRAGLEGGKSSAFFGFWRLMQALGREGRAPRMIVIENVVGLLTSNGGADFTALCQALSDEGYRFGALEIDAARFTPQSRPRVFVIASRVGVVKGGLRDPSPLAGEGGAERRMRGRKAVPPYPASGPHEVEGLCDPSSDPLRGPPSPARGEGLGSPFHSRAVRAAYGRLPLALAEQWVWWDCPEPPRRNTDLAALLEDDAEAKWRSKAQTARLLELMTPAARHRLTSARERLVGAVFRRMRAEGQKAEVRMDGLAGCLRTPRGGSSRQQVVVAQDGVVRSRLISPREGARLMGLPDSYVLPATATAALQVIGDGVAAPVVRHLAENLLEPLLCTIPLPLIPTKVGTQTFPESADLARKSA